MASRPSSTSTSKALLAGAGIVVLGGGLALAAIEIGMRAAGYGMVETLAYGRGNFHPELPEVGYAGRPNVRGIHSGEGLARLAFNSRGFHDVEHEKAKPPGVFRVVVVGNSYSMAVQVPRQDGYVAKLAQDLRSCPALAGQEIETINIAVGGFTIHQQYLMLRDYGLAFSPDLALLQVNDFVVPGDLDPLKNLSPRLAPGPEGAIEVDYAYLAAPEYKRKSSGAAALLQGASDHSRLLQYLLAYRRTTKGAGAPDTPANEAAAYENYRNGRDLAFEQMVKLAKGRTKFAVTIAPVADAQSQWPLEPNQLRQEWTELAARFDTPLLDIEEDARAEVRETGAYLHGFGAQTGTGHLNRTGNALFAKLLAPRICGLLGGRYVEAQSVMRR